MTDTLRAVASTSLVGARWRAKDIIFHDERSAAHAEGVPPNARAKWSSLPYTLPDGRTGIWWQPYRPKIHKWGDFTHSRARARLARVCRPNETSPSTGANEK